VVVEELEIEIGTMKTILVTGGCGFIGSNFIRTLLGSGGASFGSLRYDRIVNVDALTYAGNLGNLSDVEEVDAYVFSNTNILDQGAMSMPYRQLSILRRKAMWIVQ